MSRRAAPSTVEEYVARVGAELIGAKLKGVDLRGISLRELAEAPDPGDRAKF